jgi:hypothetical protein
MEAISEATGIAFEEREEGEKRNREGWKKKGLASVNIVHQSRQLV